MRRPEERELRVADLLLPPEQLLAHLRSTLERRQWLDAYLLACGLAQVVEDALHPDPGGLRRAAAFIAGRPGRTARIAVRLLQAAAHLAGLRSRLAARRATPALAALTGLRDRLADRVVGPPGPAYDGEVGALLRAADQALGLARLTDAVQTVPTSFRDFDQHPDDMAWLADALCADALAPGVPVLVVGVRTSGGYLGPLLAAELRRRGLDARALSCRPDRPLLAAERSRLRRVGRRHGRVVVTDDPPATGSAIARVCRAVEAAGPGPEAIVAAYATFAGAAALPALERWRGVTQPWPAWSIHARLGADGLERALGDLLDSTVVITAGPTVDQREERGHLRARFVAEVKSPADGHTTVRELVAEGVGIGYLGRHALAVDEALPGHTAPVIGVVDGVLFRDRVVPRASARVDPRTIARYVVDRARALPAVGDPTPRMRGREPAWETAGMLIAGPWGPLAPAARTVLLDRMCRRLLHVGAPSVVDGDTRRDRWVGSGADARKVDGHQRGFSHLDQACYDHVFDLAGAALGPGDSTVGADLRRSYTELTGDRVDDERWLLYRLVQLHRADRTGDLTSEEVRHASAEAVYDYLAALVPAPARRPTGELCAIDLDGVLESDRLGYPATTPLGMLAVRALQAHGLRPVIVTGRSLDEAVARARILGLDAAVGEYGAAAWVGGTELDLRTGEETAAVDRVRTSLGPSVEQASYRHIVRATLAGGPLPGVLEPREPSVRCVRGAQQTDIVPRAVDKGRGLAALSSSLGGVGWALAVGDTAEDLPMLAAATSAWAPSNAAAVVRAAGVRITRAPYQAGLAQAVASLLGHAPGRCDVCRPPRPGRNSRAVLAMLALPESGSRGLPVRALGASVAALRTEQRR